MLHFDYIRKENIKEQNANCPDISEHLYKILIVASFGSWRLNTLLHVVSNKPDIDRIYSSAKDLYEKNVDF